MPGKRRVKRADRGIGAPFYIIALLVFILDQASKVLIKASLPPEGSVPVINDIFHLTLVFNRGAAFGIFKSQTFFFVAIGIVTVIMLIYFLPRIKGGITIRLGLALLMGGILGNLSDRLRFGHVVDFLDFRIWPVFNIADSAITIGALLVIFEILRKKR